MGLIGKMSEGIKRGIRSWLNITPSAPYNIQINEVMDFELNAIRNRIWYRGDGNELEQLYRSMTEYADKFKFWASKSTPGMEMRKIHTGLPGLIVKVLAAVVLSDMNNFEFEDKQQEELWKEIEKKNRFRKKMEKVIKEVLYLGDGAFKIRINTEKSPYPILQWYPAEKVEFVYDGDDLQEIVFKTPVNHKGRQYVIYEHYGYGYIRNEVCLGDKEIDIKTFERFKTLTDWEFDKNLMLAMPLMVYESAKWEGRGGSIYDGKLDAFDAFDEAWSQWMDALRSGRAKTYIPECFIPRNPDTGEMMSPNPFDNRFIKVEADMGENAQNKIDTEQPIIPHDSYMASYITALDLCLQGIISPSTLGIDVKKLDNAEAQREKEKTTLYTRNAIVEALQESLPELVSICINAYKVLNHENLEEVKVSIPFGEYANPSFESQVETVSKAKIGGIMSIEASVEELYGDSKEEEWKKEEIARLKAEQGIAEVEEPGLNMSAGNFHVNVQGGNGDESKGNEPNVSDGPAGVQEPS